MFARTRRALDEASARFALELASYALGVTPEAAPAPGQRGPAQVAFARQVAMYLCHVALGMSLARTAEAFSRDRSTVAHACHVLEDRREDEAFDSWLGALEETLRMAPSPQALVQQRGAA